MLKNKIMEAMKIMAVNRTNELTEKLATIGLENMSAEELAAILSTSRESEMIIPITNVTEDELQMLKSLRTEDDTCGITRIKTPYEAAIEDMLYFKATAIAIDADDIMVTYYLYPLTEVRRRRIERHNNMALDIIKAAEKEEA